MSEKPARPKAHKCPICKSAAVPAFKPFCSKKCADIDLGKWFSGAYVVPGEPVDPETLPATAPKED